MPTEFVWYNQADGQQHPAHTMSLRANGDLEVKTGNLVIGTSGKGIDFSATSGTGTSELFDDYEEGSFSAAVSAAGYSSGTFPVVDEYYIKIGRLVWFGMRFNPTANASHGDLTFTGLPFASNGANSVASGHWQDGGSYGVTGGRINGTNIERCNGHAFPSYGSGSATWWWTGTYQTA